MKPASLFLYISIASLISGLLLMSASFFSFASHMTMLFRVVGGFFLLESIFTLWLASNKRPSARQGETPSVPAARKQSLAWVGWCFLSIVVLFGGCYWVDKEQTREDNADWKVAIAPYKHKDYVTAEAKLREFNDKRTDDWGWGHYYLALCLKHEGKIDEARDMFQETMKQNYRKKDWGTDRTQNVYYKAQWRCCINSIGRCRCGGTVFLICDQQEPLALPRLAKAEKASPAHPKAEVQEGCVPKAAVPHPQLA